MEENGTERNGTECIYMRDIDALIIYTLTYLTWYYLTSVCRYVHDIYVSNVSNVSRSGV